MDDHTQQMRRFSPQVTPPIGLTRSASPPVHLQHQQKPRRVSPFIPGQGRGRGRTYVPPEHPGVRRYTSPGTMHGQRNNVPGRPPRQS